MLSGMLGKIATQPPVRIAMVAILLMIGLAPIGATVLSDNSRGSSSATTMPESVAPQAATYRWSVDGGDASLIERSDDGGRSWRLVAAIPESIQQIANVTRDTGLVFARSRDSIWVSHDGGASWARTEQLPSRPMSMAVSPDSAAFLLAGTQSAGLFISRDLGASWQFIESHLLSNSGGAPLAITALTIDQDDSSIVYAASAVWLGTSAARLTPVGVFASVDGGRSWLPVEQAPPASQVIAQISTTSTRPLAVTVHSPTGQRDVVISATPALLTMLQNADPAVRRSAARALGLLGDVSAIPALLTRLTDADVLAADRAAEAIGLLGDRTVIPQLLQMLEQKDEAQRARAAHALGLLQSGEATDALAQMLREDGPSAAHRAAEALAGIATPQAISALVAALGAGDLTSSRHAAMTGLELAGPRAVEGLVAGLSSETAAIRAGSAEMLGWLRAGQATTALATVLQDQEAAVRSQAAWALGEIATADAHHTLARAIRVESDPIARAAIQSALARVQASTGEFDDLHSPASALLAKLGRIPADQWSFLLFFVALAMAVLIGTAPHHTGMRVR